MFVAQIAILFQYIFLIGIVLAIVGHVGRRVFADNSCWRCQFDLSGHPGVPDGPFPVVCPECGESVADAGMLKIDTRAPRVGVRRVGFVLMLGIVPVVVIFMRGGYSLDPYRVATNRGIIGLIGTGDYEAREEFGRRFSADRFTSAQRREIASRIEQLILAIPQDRIEPGTVQIIGASAVMWGNVYLALIDSGDVTEAEAQALFDRITSFSLKFPLHNRVDDPFFCRVEFHGHSIGTENLIVQGIELRVTSLRVDDIDLSSLPVTRSDAQLASDYETINFATTLATAWTFGIPGESFVLPESLVGTCRVQLTLLATSTGDTKMGFTAGLLERAYEGEREYTLSGDLVVHPANDRESTRGMPDIAQLIKQHGTFALSYRPGGDLLELSLTINDGYEWPNDAAIVANVNEKATGAEIIGRSKLTIRPNMRRSGTVLKDYQGGIEKQGGVWVKLDAVEVMPRDQAWRPLVITGDVEPIWVPLDGAMP